jgi:tetratricopeptide (TPR) repeat protein
MKNSLPLICFFLISTSLYSQVEFLEKQLSSTHRDTVRVNILNKLSRLHYNASPEKTKSYTKSAIALADSLHYKHGLAEAYLNESLIYRLKGENTKDLESLLKALKLFVEEKDSMNIAHTFTEIGISHHHQGDYKAAREQYVKALELHKAVGNSSGVAMTLRKIGIIESEQKEYDQAFNTFQVALQIEKENRNVEGIANLINNIGVIFYEKGEYDKALEYYSQSMPLFRETNNLNRLPAAYHNLSRVYLAQAKVDSALIYAQLGLPIAQETGNRMALQESFQLFTDIFLAKKDYQQAYTYLQQAEAIEDSVINKQNSVQYAQLKALIETERKEQEIEFLRKEKQWDLFRQKITYTGLALALFIGGVIIYYQRKTIRDKKALLEKNKKISESQQALLKVELENKQLAEKQLQVDLEFRHKELLTYTLNLVQKNTIMLNVREGVLELPSTPDKDFKSRISKLVKVIDNSLESEKDWDEFRMYFEKVHSSFFENLKARHPDLSQGELKLCALLSLNLSMKEMAELMGISPESVKMARHRLRKKLNLATEENLSDFVGSFKGI